MSLREEGHASTEAGTCEAGVDSQVANMFTGQQCNIPYNENDTQLLNVSATCTPRHCSCKLTGSDDTKLNKHTEATPCGLHQMRRQ